MGRKRYNPEQIIGIFQELERKDSRLRYAMAELTVDKPILKKTLEKTAKRP
jgi:hypothetical protein